MNAYEGRVLAAVLCLAGLMFTPRAEAQTTATQLTPTNAWDMDSVDGFFCALSTGFDAPLCRTNGSPEFSIPSLTGGKRLALDANGRVWIVRNPGGTEPPGLYVDVNNQDVLAAELPPLAAGDFVDSLVLVSQAVDRLLPDGTTQLLRTPVILTSERRLFIHVWWTTADNNVLDAAGNLVSVGNIAVTPGWYELVETVTDSNGVTLIVGTEAPSTPVVGPGPFWGRFLSLSHAALGSGQVHKVPAMLGVDARTHFFPVTGRFAFNGMAAFGLFTFDSSQFDNGLYPVLTSQLAQPGTEGTLVGRRRFAWSPKYYVTRPEPYAYWSALGFGDFTQAYGGPFILEQGRPAQIPGLDSARRIVTLKRQA